MTVGAEWPARGADVAGTSDVAGSWLAFIDAALQALACQLLSSRFVLETGTLAAQAADSALHAALGLLADCATLHFVMSL